MNSSTVNLSFVDDFVKYVARFREFKPVDWWVYFFWVGMIFCLWFSLLSFLIIGASRGAQFPSYVWNIPVGTFVFMLAIAVDTIGHRTIYKGYLAQAESLVHHITIFSGITSCVLLCLAFEYRSALKIPSLVMTFLSFFYSGIDEWMHWIRYREGRSDRIEMWSHFFIFVGHLIMMGAWVFWLIDGYPGVYETLRPEFR